MASPHRWVRWGRLGVCRRCPAGTRTLFLLWPANRGNADPDCRTPGADGTHRCLAIAAALHPAWHRCSPAARKLLARNVSILAAVTETPVHALAFWTRDGLPKGHTGMGIRTARGRGIPVLNLAVLHPRAVCERLRDVRAAASRATRRS